MIFVKPEYFEVILANWKNDDFHDEVLICTIDKDFKVIEHAPVEMFLDSRNMAIIYGRDIDGEWVNKDLMSIRTKVQQYAGWDPILTISDFEKMIQKKINKELAKKAAYANEPKKYSYYKDYA